LAAVAHVGVTANQAGAGAGNGVIGGNWDSTTATDETAIFWQHVRLAGLVSGPTVVGGAGYYPTNADGGRIGIQSVAGAANIPVLPTPMIGANVICSAGILGKFAKQLDTTLDDSNTETGSLRVYTAAAAWVASAAVVDAGMFNVCMAF
jgi:hypothetical protein